MMLVVQPFLLLFALLSRSSSPAHSSTDDSTFASFLLSNDDVGFHVQGWRWHTLALRRELHRVGKLSESLAQHQESSVGPDELIGLQQATDYTVNFNMQGLHRIEKELFFPWVRSRVKERLLDRNRHVAKHILGTVTNLEDQRSQIEQLGKSMVKSASRFSEAKNLSISQRKSILQRIANDATTATNLVDSMRHQEDSIICPTISRIVPLKEQQSFNNKVLRKLGLLDSRTHLVSMYEAVQEKEDELALFRQTIPSIAQRMIPRWKRLLYEPRIGGLQNVS